MQDWGNQMPVETQLPQPVEAQLSQLAIVENGSPQPSSSTSSPTKSITPTKRQVSSNACEPCRKRKSKCDGHKPECNTCSNLHKTPCYYDLDKDLRRKGALRQEIRMLRSSNTNFQFVIGAVCAADPRQLPYLTTLLRSNNSIDAVADILRSFQFPPLCAPQYPLPEFNGNAFTDTLSSPQFAVQNPQQTELPDYAGVNHGTMFEFPMTAPPTPGLNSGDPNIWNSAGTSQFVMMTASQPNGTIPSQDFGGPGGGLAYHEDRWLGYPSS